VTGRSSTAGLAAAGSTALSLGVLILLNPAYVQAQETAASDDTIGEIVVTGIRESLKTAQAIKQNAEQLVDSVTSQDIGALPDRSVSEALQRIPGLTLQRTNTNRDPARLASEGGGVFIRGLSWVRSETNGHDIFSANNGRDLSFEDVSADLLAGVDVYKNPSADMIEGGVGGIVNLRTRLPFDSDQRLFAISADYNYADLKEQGFFSANALYSDRWDTDAGRMGVLLSGSLGNIGNRTDSVQTGSIQQRTLSDAEGAVVGLPGGTNVYIPASTGWRTIDWEQRRTSFATAFQWAPTDALQITLQGLYAKANPKDIERAEGDYGGYPNVNPSYVFDDQGFLVAGTVNIQPQIDTRFGDQNKKTTDYSMNIKYDLNDQWSFSTDFQYVNSHADVLSLTAFTQAGGFEADGSPAVGAGGFDANGNPVTTSLDFDLRGDTPFMQLNAPAGFMEDQNNYWWAAAMDHIEDNDAQSRAARADGEFTFDDNPWLKSFRFGIRATNKQAVTRQSNWNWALLSHQYWGGGAPVYLNQTGFGSNNDPGLPNASQLVTYDNFFRGNVNLPGVGWFPAASLVSHGNQAANSLLRNTLSAGWGWSPLTAAAFNGAPAADNPNTGVNDQSEETKAAYAMLRFAHPSSPLGPFDGNIGVRFVKTDVDSIGLLSIAPIQGDPGACATANPTYGCAAFNAAFAFAQGGNQPGFLVGNSYTDVLPTFNLRFHLRDDLQLRFALGKAIVRPTFSQMMPYTTLSFQFGDALNGEQFLPRSQSVGCIGNTSTICADSIATGGNPRLKPTQANQLDTSLEWYFSPTGSVTFAAFFKDVKDYIFLGNGTESYSSNGQSTNFLATRNLNGSSGKIKGFEVAYQQFFDKLPGAWSGLGVQANFTLVDSSGGKNSAVNILDPNQTAGAGDNELPLEGLSKKSYNVAAMYEKYNISARLAYNWREKYLLTTSAANINQPVWFEDYGQLDGSVFYSITPKIKIGVQATNILNTRTFLDVGGAQLQTRYSWTDTDRRIAVAIRTSF
jgi:TonB-dependent receptor